MSQFALALAAPLLAAVLPPVCGPALDARFEEDAPRDRIVLISRSSEPEWRVTRVEIALDGSAGHLIFDTASGGPGSSVYQPFRAVGGDARLADIPLVADGARGVTLRFASFPAAGRFVFSTDLDDLADGSGIAGTMVAGAEIAGARLTATFAHPDGATETYDGRFGPDAQARAAAPCLS